ncbi:MAG: DNA methyltransferase, partial [Chloroflexota bacterium]
MEENTALRDLIINGDAETELKKIPSESVNCIITSPPYYMQRDYSTNIQIGNEETPEAYVQRLIGVFKECLRILREDGTLWLNLGDKYQNGELL